jgi:hypothetical protein
MFEAVQRSYELLLPIIESGQELRVFDTPNAEGDEDGGFHSSIAEGFSGGASQMETLQLLIKTQILICRRFEAEIGKYKYPSYQLLLLCLKLPDSCLSARSKIDQAELIFSTSYFTERRALFVKDCLELVFRSCLVSPLNADELVSESGITILYSVFDFFLHAGNMLEKRTGDTLGKVSDEIVHEILSIVVHTIAGVAYYKSGRHAIESLPNLSEFCINWRRCIDGKYLSKTNRANDSSLKKFAVEGIANMARSAVLQKELVGSGIIWPLGKFLLGYDPTLDESSILRDGLEDDIGISQASSNTLARLSARALGMVSGSLQDPQLLTPRNPELQAAMNIILTSPIAVLLRNKRTSEILRVLNTNIESPNKIWNIQMRSELTKLLSSMEKKRPEGEVQSIGAELEGISEFRYSSLKNELQIGGIYVRVFNKIGVEKGNLRDVNNPGHFAKELVSYIARCINAYDNLPEGWIELNISTINTKGDLVPDTLLDTVSITDRRFIMVMSALRILIRADSHIDDAVYVPSVLLSFLELPQDSEVRY